MSLNPDDFARMAHDHDKSGLDVTVDMHIRLHANGAMSISAPIGDVDFCLAMLRNAEDAIRRQAAKRTNIIVPGKDVAV